MNSTEPIPLAGLRGAQWNPASLPAGLSVSNHSLTTSDGANVTGTLYRLGGERTVSCLMHPREVLTTHYLVPEILAAGSAVWVQGSRNAGNDLRLEHELAVIDADAGVAFLKDRGFDRVVLVGNSGGAGLFAYYTEIATQPRDDRPARTPAGRPLDWSKPAMVRPDMVIFVAPHPGQGILLMNSLDPSVTDERDPLSVDRSLFPFSAENGYHPDGASYDEAFVARYRAAQRARVERIDAKAMAMVNDRLALRRAAKTRSLDISEKLQSAWQQIFEVPRTDADLRNWDLSLDPTDRHVGSLWGRDPFKTNMNGVGFGRVCTPESWLSTWSGLSSRASVLRCAPAIDMPVLIIRYTADACVFPEDLDEIWNALGTRDKTMLDIRGTHHGQPISQGEPGGQALAGAAIRSWLNERSPV